MSTNTEVVAQSAPKQQKLSALNLMAGKFSVEPVKLLATLKATVFKGATDDELLALVVVANTYGLNPLLKEIYAFPAKGGGIVPVVSVDGWIRMCNDHPQMDGMEFADHHDAKGELISVTCRIFRKDRRHPTVITEYLAECRRNTEPWKMANRMLRHKALIQCARVAFGFSGIQDEDEAGDTITRVATGRVVTDNPMKIANPYKETFADLPETNVATGVRDIQETQPEPEPQASPEPEPQPTGEAPPESPVEVSDDTERKALVADIKAAIKPTEFGTVALFAPKCREAGLLAVGVQLAAAPIEDLRTILANVADIAAGSFIPLD